MRWVNFQRVTALWRRQTRTMLRMETRAQTHTLVRCARPFAPRMKNQKRRKFVIFICAMTRTHLNWKIFSLSLLRHRICSWTVTKRLALDVIAYTQSVLNFPSSIDIQMGESKTTQRSKGSFEFIFRFWQIEIWIDDARKRSLTASNEPVFTMSTEKQESNWKLWMREHNNGRKWLKETNKRTRTGQFQWKSIDLFVSIKYTAENATFEINTTETKCIEIASQPK